MASISTNVHVSDARPASEWVRRPARIVSHFLLRRLVPGLAFMVPLWVVLAGVMWWTADALSPAVYESDTWDIRHSLVTMSAAWMARYVLTAMDIAMVRTVDRWAALRRWVDGLPAGPPLLTDGQAMVTVFTGLVGVPILLVVVLTAGVPLLSWLGDLATQEPVRRFGDWLARWTGYD